jgi:endonuclease/exonuclease/phosphatase family metal-dependent hydrolase
MNRTASFSVANFNVHAGIDGWGRRFDAVGACERIGADILVVEEDWVGDDPAESIADLVAKRQNREIVIAPSGSGRRLMPPEDESLTPARWAPLRIAREPKPILFDGPGQRARASSIGGESRATRGSWATSLVSRFPIVSHELVPLPMLRSDPARRQAIFATIDVRGAQPITVIGVHLGHLTHGSPRQMDFLRRAITRIPGHVILVGDLNCWGPPLRIFLRGVHDTVRGATWPAWRPHSRIDHILTTDVTTVESSRVLEAAGSDHLPIITTFNLVT